MFLAFLDLGENVLFFSAKKLQLQEITNYIDYNK